MGVKVVGEEKISLPSIHFRFIGKLDKRQMNKRKANRSSLTCTPCIDMGAPRDEKLKGMVRTWVYTAS